MNKLKSRRLHYKRITKKEEEGLRKMLKNPNVTRFLPGGTPYSDERIDTVIKAFKNSFDEEKPHVILAVYTKETNEFIGYTGVTYVKELNHNEIMYGFLEEFWNKGYATEAALRMKEYAISLGLDFIIALADVRNDASQRVIEKIGFEYQKTIELWGMTLAYFEQTL